MPLISDRSGYEETVTRKQGTFEHEKV
jgi:hypothetical protein